MLEKYSLTYIGKEYIKNLNLELKLDTNVKGLHPRLEYSSEYGFSMSIEVEK